MNLVISEVFPTKETERSKFSFKTTYYSVTERWAAFVFVFLLQTNLTSNLTSNSGLNKICLRGGDLSNYQQLNKRPRVEKIFRQIGLDKQVFPLLSHAVKPSNIES